MAGNDYDDLRGFDLSKLDLEEIELDIERPPSPVWRWLAGVTLLGLITAAVVYGDQLRAASNNGWTFGLSIGAIVLGITFGRWIWAAAVARAERAEAEPVVEEPEGPPSAGARWFTFLLAAGSAGTLVTLVQTGTLSAWFGDQAIFVSGAGAIFIGIVFSRWLTMQGEAARAARQTEEEEPPIELPPWFKWVTFAGIVALAGFVALSNLNNAGDFDFSIGGLGFAVGLFAAIWLARRFEELEQKGREERRSPRT
jgi:hypothetical protein